MLIIGIDPGTTRCGFGVIDFVSPNKFEVKEWGIVSSGTSVKDEIRLANIQINFQKLLSKYQPDLLAIEELFFVKNIKTGLAVAQARGVVLALAGTKKIKVFQFKPTQIKQALTGYGRASKRQMQKMIKLRLKLDRIPQPDDASDALAVAVCAFSRAQFEQRLTG